MKYLLFVLVSTWLITCAMTDWRTGRVPNILTLPVMLLGMLLTSWHVVTQGDYMGPAMLAILWALFYAGWAARWYGGGDAKIRMALAALWPRRYLLIALLLSAILAGVIVLILDFRRTRPMITAAVGRLMVGLSSGQLDLLRSDSQELHQRGRRGTWEIALGGIGYVVYTLLL